MEISGKVRIANKWNNGQIDKNSFDFEVKIGVGKGRLTWTSVEKGKNGAKDSFISSTKKFVCFGNNTAFIEKNLGQQLEIKGRLVGKQFVNGEGKKVKFEEIFINEVSLAETEQSKHHQAKSNGYQPQVESEELDSDSEIPF